MMIRLSQRILVGILTFMLLMSSAWAGSMNYASAASQSGTHIGQFQAINTFPQQDRYIVDAVPYGDNQVLVLTNENGLFRYDGNRDVWTSINNLPIKSPWTMTVLNDGRILILAGIAKQGTAYNANVIYDPVSGKFESVSPIPVYINNLPALNAKTLHNGKVLVMGNYRLYGLKQYFAYEYDPVQDEWQEAVKVSYAANELEINHIGDVLNYGGGLSDYFPHGIYYDASQHRYYTISSLPYVLNFSATTSLADGSFLLAGGSTGASAVIEPSHGALVFLPKKNEWRVISFMQEARAYPDAALLPDGRAIVIGGLGIHGRLKTTEIYNPKTDTWTKGPNLHHAYEQPKVVELSGGDLLVLGNIYVHDRRVIVGERLKLSQVSSKDVISYNLDLLPVELRGTTIARERLFTHEDWIYRAEYQFEEDVFSQFGHKDFSYTRMYVTRHNEKTSSTEIVVDGRVSFLRLDGEWMYFIQDGYLKRLKLGERYAELIRFPRSFRADPTDRRLSVLGDWRRHAEQPIDLGMQYFDGEYIYTWWPSWDGTRYTGFPIRVHYTGSRLEVLSMERATEYRPDLVLADGWLLYQTKTSEHWNWNRTSVLHAVKMDGSEERELAEINSGFQVIDGRIYYRDANDPVQGVIQTGKLYSMNPDGTDKRLLSEEGSGQIYKYNDQLIFETFNTGTIIQMNPDGSNKKVLLQGNKSVQYDLVDVRPGYIIYNKRTDHGEKWLGTFKMTLSDRKEVRMQKVEPSITVRLDGRNLSFPQEPIRVNNRVLVPMRAIFEALGADVHWDPATHDVTAKLDDVEILIRGSEVYLNNVKMKLDQAPIIRNGTTLVPIRFITESLGAEVEWVGRDQSVNIILER